MKKYLFISNNPKPSYEELISRDPIVLTNDAKPCVEIALSMGYKVFVGVNRINAEELSCAYDINFFFSSTYRSLFDIKSNYTAFRNLISLLNKEKIDVIHCNTPIGGMIARISARIAKVPKVIYTAHGFHFFKGSSLASRTLIKWAEMWLAFYTDALITINKEDYEAAKKFKLKRNGKVYYVPGVGVDTDIIRDVQIERRIKRSEFGLNDNHFVLITTGRLERNKNIENMIKSLKNTHKNVILFICGEGKQKDYLVKLAKELEIIDRVIFAGYRDDVFELLKMSDAFISISYREGLSRSIMEAMAAGLPCIVSEIRGNVDLIEHNINGYNVNPNNVDEISNYIRYMKSNRDSLIAIGDNNARKVKLFDIKNVKGIMDQVYREVFQ